MGLRIAFLALLLIAKSSQFSEDRSACYNWTDVLTRLTPQSIINREMVEEVVTTVFPADFNYSSGNFGEMCTMGNTIFGLTFDSFNLWEKVGTYYKEAVYNGILCELGANMTESVLRAKLYGNNTAIQPRAQREYEEAAARNPMIGIDCTSAAPDTCFCSENKPLFYCMALRLKKKIVDLGFSKRKCINRPTRDHRNIVLSQIRRNDRYVKKKYTYQYIVDILKDDYYQSFYNTLSNIYCRSVYDDEEATKEEFAANAYHWTMDLDLYAGLGPIKIDVNSACLTNPEFKATEFGKCLCTFAYGYTFCLFKSVGVLYERQGYLTRCTGLNYPVLNSTRPTPAELLQFGLRDTYFTTPFDKNESSSASSCLQLSTATVLMLGSLMLL